MELSGIVDGLEIEVRKRENKDNMNNYIWWDDSIISEKRNPGCGAGLGFVHWG